MSTIYLIRHGQAGTRDHYDVLSGLGARQARLLGEHFAERKTAFDAIYVGGLNRQQETARIAATASSASAPGIVTDERWNEFILKRVYESITPRLMKDSPEFAHDFEEMRREVLTDPHTVRGAAGRCDRAVIEAWMENRYPDDEVESWDAFRARVRKGFESLMARDSDDAIAVFTSVTPIAVCLGDALSLRNEKILRLMAVMYNTGVTVMKIRFGEPLLFHFNATPHLTEDGLLTFR